MTDDRSAGPAGTEPTPWWSGGTGDPWRNPTAGGSSRVGSAASGGSAGGDITTGGHATYDGGQPIYTGGRGSYDETSNGGTAYDGGQATDGGGHGTYDRGHAPDGGGQPSSEGGAAGTTSQPLGPTPYGQDTLGQEPRRVGRFSRSLALPAAALALAGGVIGGGVGAAIGVNAADSRNASVLDSSASLGAAPPRTSSVRPPGSVAAVAQAVLPTVVSINVTTGGGGDTGTGVIIRSDGYVLTNNHVIAAAASGGGTISVQFNNGRSAGASIVGRDPKSDLAVIKVQGASGLKAARLGSSSNLVVGDPVIAIGSPLGLTQTVTTGIVSAKDRPVSAGGDTTGGTTSVIDAIQTDAAINPGNSGGPLVNMNGEVVGINSAIASLPTAGGGQTGSIGLGFAIPIDQARSIAEEIIRTGKATHPILGISAQTLDETAASSIPGGEPGALVYSSSGPAVVPGGPADKAGIKAGDIIIAIDGHRVTGVDELVVETRKHRIGDTVSVTYIRNGKKSTVQVTLGSDANVGG